VRDEPRFLTVCFRLAVAGVSASCAQNELPHEADSAARQQALVYAANAGSPATYQTPLAALGAPDPQCSYGAADTDGDGLCDIAETSYGTDPENPDTDGDALGDGVEIYGYVSDAGALDLPSLGANPLRRDVFLEIDYMPGLAPTPSAVARVVQAFAEAPVKNPDGTSGVTLHAEVDQQIASADAVENMIDVENDFKAIKSKYFEPIRAFAFHYAVFGDRFNDSLRSGRSFGIPGTGFVVTLGAWRTRGGTELQQAGTLMHELGHNLGLTHGGGADHMTFKPNFLSVMNYHYQTDGLRRDGLDGQLDYARVGIQSLNESTLYEPSAFQSLDDPEERELGRYSDPWICTAWSGDDCAYRRRLFGNAARDLDFSGNQHVDNSPVAVDLNGLNGSRDTYAAIPSDWHHLVFRGDGVIGNPDPITVQTVSESIDCMSEPPASE